MGTHFKDIYKLNYNYHIASGPIYNGLINKMGQSYSKFAIFVHDFGNRKILMQYAFE